MADSPVQAGMPTSAESSYDYVSSIDEMLVRVPSRTELVRVKGDSMVDSQVSGPRKGRVRAEAGEQSLSGHPPPWAPGDLRRHGGPRPAQPVAHSMSLGSTSLDNVTNNQ